MPSDVTATGPRPRLAAVLRMVLEHLDAGAVVAVTPAEGFVAPPARERGG